MTTEGNSLVKNRGRRNELRRKRYAADPGQYKTQRRWVAAHPEKVTGAKAAWRARNPEKARDATLTWRARNKKKVNEARRSWGSRNKEKLREYEKRLDPERRRESVRASYLLRAYGLSVEAYESMIIGQGGRCASCGDPLPEGKQRHVDHDHATGRVRGVLCHHCNLALGLLREDCARIRGLMDYLTRTSS